MTPASRDPNMNVAGLLEYHAERRPDAIVAVVAGVATTYAELAARVRKLAAGLQARGVGEGDIVGLLSHNSLEFLEVMFATNHIGAVLMPINFRLAPVEVAYILENSDARLLFADSALIELAVEAIALTPTTPRLVGIDCAAPNGGESLALLRGSGAGPRAVFRRGGDLHRLMYTSGTTGHPKGVRMSHANLHWKNLSHTAEFGFTANDIGLACGPMYHVGALDATITTMLYVGGSVVIQDHFESDRVVSDIETYGVTNVWLAPTMISRILADPRSIGRDLTSLTLLVTGGEKMPEPLVNQVARLFPNAWFADGYGLTEGVSADTILPRANTLTKLGSVGRPCLFVELEIHDLEGHNVSSGIAGEIVTRSPKLFDGYWRDPVATDRAFAGGWFHTGDVGYLDGDGFLYLVDRIKDMIRTGGENVASLEIERVIYQHPAVLETAVVGRPDPNWGEVPCAFVVLKPGSSASSEEIVQHCRGQLAAFKVPKSITFTDSLPRNLSGKILKRSLRDLLLVD